MGEIEAVFRKIFADNAWGGTESVSGHGSSAWSTSFIRRRIPALLEELGVQTLLDAPCGDFNWMREVPLTAAYIGGDVVADLIAQNRQRYEDGRRRFVHLDLTADPLPRADLILCRDGLVHLTFDLIHQALRNMRTSGAAYLLTTTFPMWTRNRDLSAVGDWRPLNFVHEPFLFPAPEEMIAEINVGDPLMGDKSLGLWRLKDLPLR